LVAFAGYPLLVEDRLVGVVAMFARHTLTDTALQALASISKNIAAGMERKRMEESLHESEEKYRGLFENSRDAILTVDPATGRFIAGNPAALKMFRAKNEQEFLTFGPGDLSPEWQPDGSVSAEKARQIDDTVRRDGSHFFEWTHRRINGEGFSADVLLTRVERGGKPVILSTVRDITERKRTDEALRESHRFLQSTLDALSSHIAILADHGTIIEVNAAWNRFARENGFVGNYGVGDNYLQVCRSAEGACSEEASPVAMGIRSVMDGTRKEFYLEYPCHSPQEQRWFIVRATRFAGAGPVRVVVAHENITERKRLESQLFQAQKLESAGQLAAGIAHEINTPTQYVGDNTRFVKDSFAAILKVLKGHEELLAAAKQNALTPELLVRHEAVLAASDLEYLCEQIPLALTETLEGVGRVSKIVQAMKEFSHPGGKEKTLADLNKAVESTVTVARNEWKYVAELKLELEPNLPLVPCFLGEFNQCILNLIVNAAHTIADVVKQNPGTKGLITVQTRRAGDQVAVRVTDTGTGIPEVSRPKIFAPFFTTKEVGKGTGQGLSIIYGSIVKRHGGTVTFETEVGRGTTFIIRLPINSKPAPETQAA
jgi:PAS domain S-box-containing protein